MSKNTHMTRMRRRIWWSIYVGRSCRLGARVWLTGGDVQVRERQVAAALGLPSRIRDEDCDMEPLSASDLESEVCSHNHLFGSCQPEHMTYAIKMVEIARLRRSPFIPGLPLGR